ncbi:phosphoglycolate/pyridoxal phosphate phosphatase [Allomyces macrogynus ATCC 38327]|uniref:4-nitrophenylphosphatase n=1 Tax=Allomyces macrogynus (strain ATCC 38327) TaxID=578462 RepID=A0A0L0S6T2_ALLM3|nr:phosphoglycolate/pyridoxal phosphate phosphatase [Allomyces macrogynus ATCC 38327]|eukprot:KNE58135.1 phosphoglycolate/pyridoxal phosphate phosphatase [Allomyces macrogynus ATCC 38327]
MTLQHLTAADDLRAFVDRFDTFLLDMDGVLWQGSDIIDGARETLAQFRAMGKRLIFVTNNSTKSRDSYVEKLTKLGFTGVTADEIFGSSYATACYFTTIDFPKDKLIYVMGQQGIVDEFTAQGFQTCGLEDQGAVFHGIDELIAIQPDERIGAVVCGFDGYLNYTKLAKAHTYLQDPEVLFIATNADSQYPVSGRTFPGTGALFQPLITSTGRQPTVIGKPHATMLDVIVATHHLDPHRTCMVGDRLDTDIAFGRHGGCATLLVLSGVTREDQVPSAPEDMRPDYIVPSLGAFQDVL